MKASNTITIASESAPVRETLGAFCRTLGLDATEQSSLWLIDGAHPPALSDVPKDAKIIVLGPIPSAITPTLTIPAPMTLEAIREALSDHLDAQSITLRNGWNFDFQHRTLKHAENSISLTEKEAALLQALLHDAPQEVSRETLLKQIWSYDKEVDTHTVETHIYRLRQKCEAATPAPFDLVTQDSGYKIVL
jgi:hypothetical protein